MLIELEGGAELPALWQDVDAFAQVIPLTRPALILDLARVPWPSPDHRDDFIEAVTGRRPVTAGG